MTVRPSRGETRINPSAALHNCGASIAPDRFIQSGMVSSRAGPTRVRYLSPVVLLVERPILDVVARVERTLLSRHGSPDG
jgi:hypothetical protein